jgi:hypothetical protein
MVQNNEHATVQAEDARRMCEILGVDFAAIEGEAVRLVVKSTSFLCK